MKSFKSRIPFLLILLVLILIPFTAVMAKGVGQDAPPPVADTAVRVIDMAFLLAITGFFKERFEVRGNAVLIVAFFVGLFLWFSPELSSIAPWVAGVIAFIKWFLGALGTFDTAIDVQKKFANA